MYNMYTIIESLCTERGIRPGKLCADLSISRGILSDLKAGRTKQLSVENIGKVASYFGVSTDYLLGNAETKNAPAEDSERRISDAELKFALWGDCADVDDEDLDDVRRYAAFVRERKKRK